LKFRDDIQYDFITGLPRSGTTLLALILNNNESVLALLESGLTMKIRNSYYSKPFDHFEPVKAYITSVIERIDEIPFDVDVSSLFKVLSVREDTLKSQLINVAQEFRYLGKSNVMVSHILEKNPGFSFKLKFFYDDFKNSKFIWMTRDYRGFVNSRIEKRNPKNRIHNPIFLGYLWNEFHHQYFKYKKINFLVVEYEKFTVNKIEELQRVLSFLEIDNLEMDKAFKTEDFSDKISLTSERRKNKFSDLSSEITQERNLAWKLNLSKRVVFFLDVICSKNYAKLKGEKMPSVSFLKKSLVFVLTFHWLVLAKVYVFLSSRG
jgi:hypothetical protein